MFEVHIHLEEPQYETKDVVGDNHQLLVQN